MDYDVQIQALEREIFDAKTLRDAQREGSAYYRYYQATIDTLTGKLIRLTTSRDSLVDLDTQIDAAEWEADRLSGYADRRMDALWDLTKFAGIVGILCLVAAATFPSLVWWVPATGLFALAVAGGTIYWAARIRGSLYGEADAAKRHAEALSEQRNAILTGQPWPPPSEPQWVDAKRVEDPPGSARDEGTPQLDSGNRATRLLGAAGD